MKTYKVFMDESATLTGAAGGATLGGGIGATVGTVVGATFGGLVGATAGVAVDATKYVYKKNKEQRAKIKAKKEKATRKKTSNAADNDHTTPKDNQDPSRADYDHDKYKERKKAGDFK